MFVKSLKVAIYFYCTEKKLFSLEIPVS